MKRKLAWPVIFAGVQMLLSGGCSSFISAAPRSSRSWEFVQSVGGIAPGEPARDRREHIWLPIRCDVSGTRAITVQPAAMNSALHCDTPLIQVRASTIYLTIRTTAATRRNRDSSCPSADLGTIPPGNYSVVYLDPDRSEQRIGTVRIP